MPVIESPVFRQGVVRSARLGERARLKRAGQCFPRSPAIDSG